MGRQPQCEYCASGSRHPLFVYLLSDKRCINNPQNHKVVPYVGLASNPFVKLCAHNRLGRQFGGADQMTKAGAPHYQLELVFGPMISGGNEFKMTCRKSSRKITHRIVRFCEIASVLMKRKTHRKAKLYVRDQTLVRQLYSQK